MLSLAAVLGALIAPAFAEARSTILPDSPGRWQVVKAECTDSVETGAPVVPEKGGLYLTVEGSGQIRTLHWSRWDATTDCWTVSPGILFESTNDEAARVLEFLPGYVYVSQQLVEAKGFQVGLRCPAAGQVELSTSFITYSPRPGDKPGDFEWLEFDSHFCTRKGELDLTFKRL